MEEIIVRIVNMDLSAKGCVVLDENCDYNIYLNAAYSIESQNETLEHELKHIRLKHFSREIYTNEMESEANENSGTVSGPE